MDNIVSLAWWTQQELTAGDILAGSGVYSTTWHHLRVGRPVVEQSSVASSNALKLKRPRRGQLEGDRVGNCVSLGQCLA